MEQFIIGLAVWFLFGAVSFACGFRAGWKVRKIEEKPDDPSVRNVDEIIRKNGI